MTVLDIVIDQPHDHMEVGGRTMPGAIVERTQEYNKIVISLCSGP